MQASSSPSVLIVRLDAIGDALVTVPLVAALRSSGFGVGAVLTERNAQAFSQRALQHVHLASPDVVDEIRKAGYSVALIPSEEPEAYEIARDAGIAQRIGFEHGLFGKPFKSLWIRRQCTRTVRRGAGLDTQGRHEAEVVFDLAARLLPGQTAPKDAAMLRPLVVDAEPAPDARIAFQVTEKWLRLGAQFEDVVELARLLQADYAMRFIGADHEREIISQFRDASNATVETFPALPPWKSAIAAARALVAPDSGAVHVAGMTGTPVVAAYARERFDQQTARWRPWASPQRLIALNDGWAGKALQAAHDLVIGTTNA